MQEDDGWPDDMPPVEESLGLADSSGLDEEDKEELADAIDEDVGDDEDGDVSGEHMNLIIDGERTVFFSDSGCERCGDDGDGVLHRDSIDARGVTGGGYMLCGRCKGDVMSDHESEGYEWTEF